MAKIGLHPFVVGLGLGQYPVHKPNPGKGGPENPPGVVPPRGFYQWDSQCPLAQKQPGH